MATAAERKLTEVRKIIRRAREAEPDARASASSRSTGLRNVLKRNSGALSEIEALVNARPRRRKR